MALQDKLAKKAARVLNPGESIQAIVAVQNFHPAVQLLGFLWVYLFGGRYNLIVATDQRIAILQTKLTTYRHPTGVAASLPRTTTLGPVGGPPASIELNGKRFYLIAGTKKYVAIADQHRPAALAGN
ncbi:MAG: hypothetical protein JO246_16255 [Frankiaceae bacterium]|nr:hypothetical protein [Frankiaceae bacterium]MBV9870119.1 hypothetical protein [Frankiaceae bacterium]